MRSKKTEIALNINLEVTMKKHIILLMLALIPLFKINNIHTGAGKSFGLFAGGAAAGVIGTKLFSRDNRQQQQPQVVYVQQPAAQQQPTIVYVQQAPETKGNTNKAFAYRGGEVAGKGKLNAEIQQQRAQAKEQPSQYSKATATTSPDY